MNTYLYLYITYGDEYGGRGIYSEMKCMIIINHDREMGEGIFIVNILFAELGIIYIFRIHTIRLVEGLRYIYVMSETSNYNAFRN